MKKIIYSMALAAGLAGGLTSCADFLELEPQNEILFENFWNEKADVDAIVAGCYTELQSDDAISRMMIWGEFRSDNVTLGREVQRDQNLENILKENLKASNGYTNWEKFYSVINRCNTVIKYAPMVAERDLSFTEGELKATIAEVSALRDLCYFYLIRTFRDVPYSTEAYTDDDQVFDLPATKFDAVLDSLINDLENVKDDAVRKYPKNKPLYQVGRITKDAIHAMLCEMYLWKKDYNSCIRYADMIIDAKKKDEEERRQESNSMSSQGGTDIFSGYPLIAGVTGELSASNKDYGNAYYRIFGNGNSESEPCKEVIFELVFMEDDNMPSNGPVNNFFGNADGVGLAMPASFIAEDISSGSPKVFRNRYDVRFYENVDPGEPAVMKFVSRDVVVDFRQSDKITASHSLYPKDRVKSNWIIYRLTDIMLLKAEALTQLCSDSYVDVDSLVQVEDAKRLSEAFTLVNLVNKRSLAQYPLKDTLKASEYTAKYQVEELVLQERHRELMFEGKRWFDLVRTSMRKGNTDVLINNVLKKYTTNTSAIQSKFRKMDAIFWPYNLEELKVNKNLKQNPAYGSTEEEGNYEKA